MIKYLADKYYFLLVIVVIYIVFNLFYREYLISKIFNIDTSKSIIDATNYANSTTLRNAFVFTLWGSFCLVGIISLVLLFFPEGKALSKWILICVPTILVLLFLCVALLGGFS